MQGLAKVQSSSVSTSRFTLRQQPFAAPTQRKQLGVFCKAGRSWSTADEGAAQVKRLISRDKKEFLGNGDDILDKYNTEFGDGSSSSLPAAGPTVNAGTPNPFGAAPVSSDNPFGSAPSTPASPFGSAPATPSPFKSSVEPAGLRPDMSPDPIVKETPISFLKSITLTQVVLALSFTTIIGIMLATFKVVLGTGAIRLAGLD